MDFSHLLPLAERVLPVLGFLIAVTIVSELLSLAGVFDVAAHAAARLGRGSRLLLWLLLVALACASTIILSIDSTAVLLTPVAITVSRQVGMSPLPFAMTTLWLANTASLLLPVSNLTNLMALFRLEQAGQSARDYLAISWPASLAAIAGTVLCLAFFYRGDLRGRYTAAPRSEAHDVPLLVFSCAVALALAVSFVLGVRPWLASAIAAAALAAAAMLRDRKLLRGIQAPWVMALAVAALFVLFDAALRAGLRDVLIRATGSGESPLALFRLAGFSVLAANAVNNLPAYMALEAASLSPHRLMALLIGVNAGPLITPWASLATLLWLQRCRAAKVAVRKRTLAAQGAACALVSVGLAVLALVLA